MMVVGAGNNNAYNDLSNYIRFFYNTVGMGAEDLVLTKGIVGGLTDFMYKSIVNLEVNKAALPDILLSDKCLNYIRTHQPLDSEVASDVIENVKLYFKESNLTYNPISISRSSNAPGDEYMYSVIATKENGDVACWTHWNNSIQSLNHGHYNLTDIDEAKEIITKNFFDITDDKKSYGCKFFDISVEKEENANKTNIISFNEGKDLSKQIRERRTMGIHR